MRIALTHNLQVSGEERQAEFDTEETISRLTRGLEALGHEVERLEVSGPVARTVARLEALSPDLIFNTAEGARGRFREAFFPALFDQLGLKYTGSDAHVCALTLDKHLCKVLASQAHVPTPSWALFEHPDDVDASGFRFPVMVKPNFEGSSKGVTQDSVVERPEELRGRVSALLARYPEGVLVEEFIVGRDVTVPFLELARTEHGGVLVPAEYVFDEAVTAGRKWAIYDYSLKQEAAGAVEVRVPAFLPDDLAEELQRLSLRLFRTFGIRDLGRMDWRITPEGEPFFIEANALPSLEAGAALFDGARVAGIEGLEAVLEKIIESASVRQGLRKPAAPPSRKRRPLRVGLIYNVKRVQPERGGAEDSEAEYDSPETIRALGDALASWGHEVVPLEARSDLLTRLGDAELDLVFNIAEGFRGRNREAQVPAVLELLDIPYAGSDPATLALALDKGLAKRVVRQAGIRTPDFVSMWTGRERLPKGFRFPVIIKPVAEGSSKGVLDVSVFEEEGALREAVRLMARRYDQPVLVESFLPGREFTVALLGERRPRVLPPMEIIFEGKESKYPVYSFDSKLEVNAGVRYEVPAKVSDVLRREIERVARGSFMALDCRDVGRVDVRLDAEGRVNFIECNPLPGMTPGWSDLCLIADAAGIEYRQLVREILAPAIRRMRRRERERRTALGGGPV